MRFTHGFLRAPIKARQIAQPFNPDLPSNLLLRLRSFLGVNARCEILAYLMIKGRGSPRAMSRACGYYPATVAKALAEMNDSGYLTSRVEGRHRFYTLATEAWGALLLGDDRPAWINSPPLFRALEQTWLFLNDEERAPKEPLAQASNLRRLLKSSLMDQLASSGVPVSLGDYNRHFGEALLPYFITLMSEVMGALAPAE